MSSEEMGLVPARRLDGSLNAAQLLFHDNGNNGQSLRFSCSGPGGGLPQPRVIGDLSKGRELSGFVEDKLFPSVDRDRYFSPQGAAAEAAGEFRRCIYGGVDAAGRRGEMDIRDWKRDGVSSTDSEGAEEDDDIDEEEEEEDVVEEGDGEGMVFDRSCIHGDGGGQKRSGGDGGTIRNGNSKDHTFSGLSGSDANKASTSENNQQRRFGHFQDAVTVADPDCDMYYSQFWHSSEGPSQGKKDTAVGDNGCGFSGRKDSGSASSDLGEMLRAIFSDPVTGVLMDDAMILPCGHSFGGSGVEHIIRMKACYTCSQPVTQDSISPNLSLRAAVQAFRCEEEQIYRASKRRRERLGQDKSIFNDSGHCDSQRGRGVQFPFAVADRVIIKGNKRTPQRFVGRKAVVTTQCLNGWYVVKTLDNAESVKLQYRSLAKLQDNPSSKPQLEKATTPHWL